MLQLQIVARKPYTPKDHYFKKAKDEGLRARSAFKIDEIARRFSIFRKGQTVVDLGAAPGGFLQIIRNEVGPTGKIVGIDLAAIAPLGFANVQTAVLDVLSDAFDAELESMHPGTFDVVISDLAPKTSGIRSTDEARSLRLARKALEISRLRGSANSSFVAKLFMGGDFDEFRTEVRALFHEVKIVRPQATRGASMEVYVVGLRRLL